MFRQAALSPSVAVAGPDEERSSLDLRKLCEDDERVIISGAPATPGPCRATGPWAAVIPGTQLAATDLMARTEPGLLSREVEIAGLRVRPPTLGERS